MAFETGIIATFGIGNWTASQNLPPDSALSNGQYSLKAVAFDRAGNAGIAKSTITISRTAAMPNSTQLASAEMSSATVKADEARIQLSFTGALNSAIAGDKSHYTAQVNGQNVAIDGVVYDPDGKSVLVVLPEGSVVLNDQVQVQWRDLRDIKGGLVEGETGILPAQ